MPTPSEQLLSRTIYDIDGTTTVWDFSFAGGYLDATHVKAYTELPTGARTTVVVTPEMLIGEFQLQITPALAADAGVLVIYRETPKDLPLVDFTEGALTEIALDTNAKQGVFVAAEAQDVITTSNFGAALDAAVSAGNSALAAAGAASEASSSALSAAGAALAADASADAAEAAAATVSAAVDGVKDLYVAGTHYTKNVSTSVTLTAAPNKPNTVKVFFSGVYQNKDTYYLVGSTINFGVVGTPAVIDADSVEVQYEIPSQFVGLSPAEQAVLTAAQSNALASANAADASADEAAATVASLAASGGASLVGYQPAGAGAVARTVQSKLRESVSVKDFGAVGDGVADDTTALHLARDFIAATPTRFELVFPSGVYKYSVSPNWAINDAVITAKGAVYLRYTGTGNAVIIAAGVGGYTYNLEMGRFIVEASASAQNGVYVQSVHHSRLCLNVRGAGPTSSGLLVEFAVCTFFDNYICSVNEAGWYTGARPGAGLTLSRRDPGETASYCTFTNPIVEGPPVGIQLLHTLGNIFHGGTSEGCPDYGVVAAATAKWDRFYGTDFEVNGIADIYCLGTGLEFLNCDTEKLIALGATAKRCVVSGGGHETVLVDTGAQGCTLKDFTYNRIGPSGAVTDGGIGTELLNLRNGNPFTDSPMYLTGTGILTGTTLLPGYVASATITVPGARVGDFVVCAPTEQLSQLSISALVTGVDTVTFYAVNNITGADVTYATMSVRARVFRGM